MPEATSRDASDHVMKMEMTPEGRRLIAEEDFVAAHAGALRDSFAGNLQEEAQGLFLDLGAVAAMDGPELLLLAGLALSGQQKKIPLPLEEVRPELQRLLEWCRVPGHVTICGDADGAPGK